MGRGILKAQLCDFDQIGERADRDIQPRRRENYDRKYDYADAIKSAYGVFFFQHPSMLNFQQELKRKYNRSNAETVLDVREIPSNNQITRLLDNLEPEWFAETFNNNLKLAEKYGALEEYRVLDDGVLIPLDGVWYYSSENIHCEHCLHTSKDGETTYYHSMVAGAVVKPGSGVVLPLMPEMIRNEDGQGKQDCERNGARRWLEHHGQRYAWLKPTLLGDDLYSDYNTCKAVVDAGYSFIFTCKEESHPWLTETVKNSYLAEYKRGEWNGRNHLEYRYRWINGVQIRDSKETLLVNYLYRELWNEGKGKVTYKNAWVTDKEIGEENVRLLAESGRVRWKIENEHNNVLKNRGYHLEHNFGHGKNHACELYAVLNLLGFLLHGLILLVEEDYQKTWASFGRRETFFEALRFSFRRFLHESWEAFLMFVLGDEPDG